MSRKQPVILLLIIGIGAAYIFHDLRLQGLQAANTFDRAVRIREDRMSRTLLDLEDAGKKGKLDVLRNRAELLRVVGVFDFYVLHDQGDVVWWAATDAKIDDIDKKYPVFNKPVYTKEMTSFSIPFDEDLVLTVGIFKNFEKYNATNKAFSDRFLFEDLIAVFFIVVVVAFWSLRDIRALFSKIRSGDLKGISNLQTRSQESELFMRGLSGFAQSVDDLQQANSLLNKQILPSLKKEIFSGKKPPYDFNCTLVRIDINNFSTIYNSQDVTSFMKVINEFFVEVSHVVTRYGGLIHEFIGDEVIVYFKDEDHPQSFLIALSALRDVNAVASEFNVRTARDFGYPFTVKSSLAHGKVRFGPLVNGYTVAGSVLIETVRILAHIHEKDGNVIFFDRSHVERLGGIVTWREGETVKLKGFNGERALCSYAGHRSLEELLAKLTLQNVHQLDFFRADEHLMMILKWLKAHRDDLSEKLLLQSLMHVREATLTKTNEDFAKFILAWCEELTKVTGAHEDVASMTLASSVVKLMIPLVPKDSFQLEYGDRLRLLMQSRDRRVVANVIEVLTHFGVPEDSKALAALEMDADARITANGLVHAGCEDVSRSVVKSLRKLLLSKDANRVASGLYALGEIALFHRKKDYVYFSTQIGLKELLQTLPSYLKSDNPSVRHQACLAAMKTAESDILTEVEKVLASSPKLSIELRPLLGEKKAA